MLDEIEKALKSHGLMIHGALALTDDDGFDPAYKSLILIGHKGGGFWPVFNDWWDSKKHEKLKNPLDDWSKSIIDEIAKTYNLMAIYPSAGPPFYPFQNFAKRALGQQPTPFGILIDESYGTWCAWRGALLLCEQLESQPNRKAKNHPCDHCDDKPCLTTCPVDAVSLNHFDHKKCKTHLLSAPFGDLPCHEGCLVRRACPIGQKDAYGLEQQKFHMKAFLNQELGD